jgi:transmembrane sensor
MTPYIEHIFEKFLAQRCTREEALWLLAHFESQEGQQDMVLLIERELEKDEFMDNQEPFLFDQESQYLQLQDRIQSAQRLINFKKRMRWMATAAILTVFAAVGFMLYPYLQQNFKQTIQLSDVNPGGNRATLTLADGSEIILNEAQKGIVLGEELTYYDGSDVLSEDLQELWQPKAKAQSLSSVALSQLPMVIRTPKGGTYSVKLTDGTVVYLNADSQIKYPYRFADHERVVEIIGEAYFSVSKDPKRPFKVRSRGQEIEVLGTEFNVSVYPEDLMPTTTLVEGAIGIQSLENAFKPFRLSPGDQAVWQNNQFFVQQVETELYTAWKDGYFYFNRTPIKEILRQAALWYDVEVTYTKGIPNETFTGEISRNVSLRGLMEIFKLSTIDVEVKDKTIIVH